MRSMLLLTNLIVILLTTATDAFVIPKPSQERSWQTNKGAYSLPTVCNLFFGTRSEKKVESNAKFSSEVIQTLQSESLTLPYTFVSNNQEQLTIRYLERHDLPKVVPMCVKEFGTTPAVPGFPWNNLNSKAISEWFDSILFPPFVSMSLEMKIARRIQGNDPSMPEVAPDYTMLCLEEVATGNVVSLVELSIQPLDPERNPPPVPLPLFWKQRYSEAKNFPQPNGWVTNLLVDEPCRGKGYSKLLMLAVEGMAKQWGCTSISLHVDADTVTGKIPQRLYETLGYQPVVMDAVMHQFDWMEPQVLQTGLYLVDGVPLVFLQKSL